MIEKLKRYIKVAGENMVEISCPPEPQDIMDKINELVDAVNEIMTWRFDCDDESPAENVQPDTESRQKNVQDQTKWLGKLCRFWDGNEQISHLRWGILSTITPTSPLPFCCSLGDGKTFDYEHCEPVKPDDDIIYKGGDNE